MGFLATFLKATGKFLTTAAPAVTALGVGGVVGAVATALVTDPAVPAVAALTTGTPKAQAAALTSLGLTPAQVAATRAGLAVSAGAAPAVAGAVVRMKNISITTVQTINPAGQIVKQVVLAGKPFLMRKDFVTAKRVIKAIRKAGTKIPKVSVPQSKTKQLTDAVMDKALASARCVDVVVSKPVC